MLDPSLLAAVVAAPADDAVRLVCADWFEEHSDLTRAEFVRLQLATATLKAEPCVCGNSGDPTGCWRCRKLAKFRKREQKLLDAHGADWFRADRGVMPGAPLDRNVWMYRQMSLPSSYRYWLGYRRGFLATFDGTLQDWKAHGSELVRRYPMERVGVSNRVPHNNHAGISTSWGWITAERPGDSDLSCCLPADLYDFLDDDDGIRTAVIGWSTLEAAQRALSTACLAWARSQEPYTLPPHRVQPKPGRR